MGAPIDETAKLKQCGGLGGLAGKRKDAEGCGCRETQGSTIAWTVDEMPYNITSIETQQVASCGVSWSTLLRIEAEAAVKMLHCCHRVNVQKGAQQQLATAVRNASGQSMVGVAARRARDQASYSGAG